MVQDVLRDLEGKMKKSAEALRHHLATVRTGRATPALVESLPVEAYGDTMPLNQLANIAAPDARMITIQPFDASNIKAIGKAIANSDLGLNPTDDGRMIRLVLPPLTEDRRRELTKTVRTRVEESKVAIRNLRRDAIDELKLYVEEKEISEDDQRRGQEKVQEITDKYGRELDQIGAAKEAEVMEI